MFDSTRTNVRHDQNLTVSSRGFKIVKCLTNYSVLAQTMPFGNSNREILCGIERGQGGQEDSLSYVLPRNCATAVVMGGAAKNLHTQTGVGRLRQHVAHAILMSTEKKLQIRQAKERAGDKAVRRMVFPNNHEFSQPTYLQRSHIENRKYRPTSNEITNQISNLKATPGRDKSYNASNPLQNEITNQINKLEATWGGDASNPLHNGSTHPLENGKLKNTSQGIDDRFRSAIHEKKAVNRRMPSRLQFDLQTYPKWLNVSYNVWVTRLRLTEISERIENEIPHALDLWKEYLKILEESQTKTLKDAADNLKHKRDADVLATNHDEIVKLIKTVP